MWEKMYEEIYSGIATCVCFPLQDLKMELYLKSLGRKTEPGFNMRPGKA